MARNPMRDLVADTDAEVFLYATNNPDIEQVFSDDDADALGLTQTEGFDGLPLSEAEQWETTLNGHDESNNDRPIALAEEQNTQTENEHLRQYIAQRQQHVGEQAQREDPVRQAQLAEYNEQRDLQIMSNPRQVRDTLDQLQQQNAALYDARFNENLDAAIREHPEIQEAYDDLKALDPQNAIHRSIVQSVYHSPNPAAALWDWHAAGGSAAAGAGRRGLSLPSLNSQSPAATRSARRSSPRSDPSDMEGWTSTSGWNGDESDVFNSIWR